MAAQRLATEHSARPKIRKLAAYAGLRQEVIGRLRAGHSLDRIAGRLRYEHPGEQARWVSHDAIYTWIYALPKGELARHGILLRSGRAGRRPPGRRASPGARIVGMRSVADRPTEIAGRQVPGH